ncbi:phenylacetate--CoA ligase family protein [Desulfosporosinus youngiae]|uniref:Coenzyme F390 synthetase n=1 Tax=Desulfosporosinus youngiae DSM 17734 TaxID=768710 RepID=H5XUD5_9FIRM|nr:phenylacetate--CoA ligase family protein [Desulfosporosinus youngiae]EHQ89371.1 coenzyme F390 synthetase [Desulfosporosinus youngiae DSM 17734]
MNNSLLRIYLNSPFILKRVFANIEAVRRDRYRRFEDSSNGSAEVDYGKSLVNEKFNFDINKINTLLKQASCNVKYYSFLKEHEVNSVEDFEKIPLLTKRIISLNREVLISKKIRNKKELWNGSSSGSTGTPLKYYRDKNSISSERLSYDSYYKYCGCDLNKKRVRISGVKVAHFDRKKPPYWLYIDKYKQLQCSTYHISEKSYTDYLLAFNRVNADFATGFPSGWFALAELMVEHKVTFDKFKAIVTDSEGLSMEQQRTIMKAFNCPVYQTYGLGEVGMCAVQCQKGNFHILSTHYVEIINSNGEKVIDGEDGEIVVTDLNSANYPFIRYATGDLGIMHHNDCGCGIKTPYLSKIIGRVEDYILTKNGRKITRLTMIVKPAVGIKESQIIQVSRDEIVINVVPDFNFVEESMRLVLETAKEFVGDMIVTWKTVERLERMPSGKLKFLIKRI